jgi:hypothetical protein
VRQVLDQLAVKSATAGDAEADTAAYGVLLPGPALQNAEGRRRRRSDFYPVVIKIA